MNRVSTGEVLNKAYRLAYFLHQDKSMAIRIVAAATLRLNVAMAVQSKRLYYVPVGRFSRGEERRTDGIRNKALFSDLHLLQRLVYGESEPYERQKELAAQAGPPGVRADGDPATEEDLLVYFIKHLVRITTKRNAFYVTLGISRLLHSYSTLETMELYNAVIGEPERVKDDYYYRSRKAVLMHEMYQRFGQLIRACRQRRGEERFETQQSSSEQRSLVRECLRLFTPWDTLCPVPRDFDPLRNVIARLTSKSGDDENKVEVQRIHAVLHPDCFGRLVDAFGYSSPEERIEMPRFFSQQTDDESPPRQRSAPAELSAEELAEVSRMLAEQAGRRRRTSTTGVMRILVDGVERGTLTPSAQSSISFSAGDNSETIEVRTTDSGGDLLLATHLLTCSEEGTLGKAIVSSIRLEGGQKLSLRVTRRTIEANGTAELVIKFGYQETDPRRAVSLLWQRLRRRLSPGEGYFEWASVRVPARYIPAIGLVLLLSLAGYLAYKSQFTSGPTEVARVEPTTIGSVSASPAGAAIDPPNTTVQETTQPTGKIKEPARTIPQPTESDRSTVAKSPAAEQLPSPAGNDEVEDVTRSGSAVSNLKLGEVKKIIIVVRGDASFDVLRSNLAASLSPNDFAAVTTNPDEADGSLKIAVSQSGPQVEGSAQLVNARGNVLWSTGSRGRRYVGETTKVVSEIVKDLLSEIRAARTKD